LYALESGVPLWSLSRKKRRAAKLRCTASARFILPRSTPTG